MGAWAGRNGTHWLYWLASHRVAAASDHAPVYDDLNL